MTSVNIKESKYLYIIEDGIADAAGDDDDDSAVAVLNALWILSPKINDDVPIKKETIARIFPVIAGIRTIGEPRCCCAAAVSIVDNSKNNDNSTMML